MVTRSGQEHSRSLRDGREARLDGERVEDVTGHPALRDTAASPARRYDPAHDSGRTAVLTRDGVHRAHPVPRSYVRSPGTPAEERVKPPKPARDALGSESAGRREPYERSSRGAPHVALLRQARKGDGPACESPAHACLDGYDPGDAAREPR
ncbi:4-hydroxyphenylacetate 3-hydroxylase N-terminal domain-containing protein [Streptomyces roseolilacinus]|uniref:4-hydroxyphenylacetate 3-hydroxylase N-terminal domain-containing protein n=1 Tax=Streptomyces roseolilacinus TaxID=66904 RepID=UPI00382B46C9